MASYSAESARDRALHFGHGLFEGRGTDFVNRARAWAFSKKSQDCRPSPKPGPNWARAFGLWSKSGLKPNPALAS
jgi:hypothetical protein